MEIWSTQVTPSWPLHVPECSFSKVRITSCDSPARLLIFTLVLARLLRRIDRIEESNELLEQARNIQQGAMFGADELHIIGTTTFSAALNRFKADLFLNSMTESSEHRHR